MDGKKLSQVTCRTKTDFMYPICVELLKVEILQNISLEDWNKGTVQIEDELAIFTDGSLSPKGVGAGFYCQELNLQKSYKLPDYCSTTQAEFVGIQKAGESVLNLKISNRDISFYTDSKEVMNHLQRTEIYSKTTYKCRNVLFELGKNNRLRLVHIKAHKGFKGNIMADKLAKFRS